MSSDSSSKHADTTLNVGGVIGCVVTAIMIFFVSQAITIAALLMYVSVFVSEQQKDTFFDGNKLAITVVTGLIVSVVLSYLSFKAAKVQDPKESVFKFMMMDKRPTLSQCGGVVVVYGLYFLSFLALSTVVAILGLVDVDQSQQLGIDQPTNLVSLLAVFVSLVVFPPIAEEILFRGYLMGKLKSVAPKVVATAVVSIIFGIAHLEYGSLNWIAAIDTMLFSVFLVHISQSHKSLYSSMLLHALKNGVAFTILFGISY